MFKALATDVDGTLTLRRGDVRLSPHALRGVRLAEASGVRVILVSGNSLPVTVGLRTYLGARGPAVAENGSLIYYRSQVIHVCDAVVPSELALFARSIGLVESWQNPYRVHDLAFYVPGALRPIEDVLKEVEREASRFGVRVLWSGYALHLNACGGKAKGVEKALGLLGVSTSELAAIGDGENDIDMLRLASFSGAPSDAADAVKRVVSFIAKGPGGRGFLEFVRELLRRNRAEEAGTPQVTA